MRLLKFPLTILLATFLLSIGFGMTDRANAADVEVVVKPGIKAFTPQEIKVKPGDKVTWINKDQEEHFLTSAGPSSRRVVVGAEDLEIHKLLHPDENYTHVFAEPETYFYFCAIHMQMWGTVVVEK